MAELLNPINELPEISFIDDITLESLTSNMILWYGDKYREITGKNMSLSAADPMRLLIGACAVYLYQGYQYVDRAGKQDLLKYSYGSSLDNLAALKGVIRNPPEAATAKVKFMLSEARPGAVLIPAETRVTSGYDLYFQSLQDVEIPAGDTEAEVDMVCTDEGSIGNGLLPGELNTLVDPIPYISEVVNTTASSGGTDIENDESLAERVYLAPSGYSVAGPTDAYTFWAKSCNQNIGDVKVSSPSPCVVDIRFILQGGGVPSTADIQELKNYLSDKNIRPLTDQVVISAPTSKSYDISLDYYISRSSMGQAQEIQAKVEQAVADYIRWQQNAIGRGINPSELMARVMQAGAKRAVITAPVYTTLTETQVAAVGSKSVRYGGIEND